MGVIAQDCDKNHRPIILIHGFLGAGDNYSLMLQKLFEAGYCPDRCFVYDWNSMERVSQNPTLDRFVDSILKITGALQVDLAGHSAGGGVSYAYLNDTLRMKKVAHYVHIGSSPNKSPAGVEGKVPNLNIYSTADRVVKGGDIPGAVNLRFTNYDHFETVTADSVAMAIYEFLNPGKKFKAQKIIVLPDEFLVKGRVITLGQNKAMAGAKLLVKNIDSDGTPGKQIAELTTGTDGSFQLNGIEPYQPYFVYCYPTAGRPMVYYFSKINPNEPLLYLRVLPFEGMVSMMLGNLPADSNQTVFALFSNKRAIQYGRDELYVNGNMLSTEAFADPGKTAISWFLYDGNGNKESDFGLIAPLSNFPFMRAIDVWLPAGSKSTQFDFNGNSFKVPSIPASEAIIVVVL